MGDPMTTKEGVEEMDQKPIEAKVIHQGVLTTKPLEDQNMMQTTCC